MLHYHVAPYLTGGNNREELSLNIFDAVRQMLNLVGVPAKDYPRTLVKHTRTVKAEAKTHMYDGQGGTVFVRACLDVDGCPHLADFRKVERLSELITGDEVWFSYGSDGLSSNRGTYEGTETVNGIKVIKVRLKRDEANVTVNFPVQGLRSFGARLPEHDS